MQTGSRSDLHTRIESGEEEKEDYLSQPEVDEARSLQDSGISITEKSQMYDEVGEVDVGFHLPDELKKCSVESQFPRRYRITMLIFACLGNFVVIISRLYPSGFYLDFVVTEDLNPTLGTMSISIMLITSALSPLINFCLPRSIKKSPLHLRCVVLCLINTMCIALMSLVEVALKQDPSGTAVFATIFTLRGVQGIAVGLLYVLVQGEVVDLYFNDDKMPIILISAFLQIGAILSAILSAELYIVGGWVLVGLIVAAFNIFPLVLLPAVVNVQKNTKRKKSSGVGAKRELLAQNSFDSYAVSEVSTIFQTVTSSGRRVAFYLPDVMVFLNNLVCDLIAYVLPARIVLYSNIPLGTAVPLFQTGNLASLFTALTFSYIAGRKQKLDVLGLMAIANTLYYLGSIIAFASTTSILQFLNFPYQLLIGLVLMGIGEAGHLNLIIMSKFALYEKWNMSRCGLGKRSTAINNVSLSISSALGTAISAFSLTEESEVPTIVTLTGVGVVLTLGLILSRLVK